MDNSTFVKEGNDVSTLLLSIFIPAFILGLMCAMGNANPRRGQEDDNAGSNSSSESASSTEEGSDESSTGSIIDFEKLEKIDNLIRSVVRTYKFVKKLDVDEDTAIDMFYNESRTSNIVPMTTFEKAEYIVDKLIKEYREQYKDEGGDKDIMDKLISIYDSSFELIEGEEMENILEVYKYRLDPDFNVRYTNVLEEMTEKHLRE